VIVLAQASSGSCGRSSWKRGLVHHPSTGESDILRSEMATVFRVRAVLEPDEDGFHAFCPGLPGCHTWGSTKAEALENLREAASLYLESLIAHGEPIPVESHGPSSSSMPEEEFTVSV